MVHFWKISYSKGTPHFHTWAIIICNNMTSFFSKNVIFWGVLVFYFSVFEIEKGCVTLLTKNCSATWANWKNWSCKSWENASASIFFWQWFLLTTGALGFIPLRREISIFNKHKVMIWKSRSCSYWCLTHFYRWTWIVYGCRAWPVFFQETFA